MDKQSLTFQDRVRKIVTTTSAAAGALLVSASGVFAQDKTKINLNPPPGSGFAKLGDLTFGELIGGLIRISLVVAAVVFFFVLVIGGIRWILSGGDKQATEAARGQITAALVGLVIVFAAWAIVQLIETLFGVQILNLDIGTINQ